MTARESDPLIVLGDGCAAHRGKGRTVGRSLPRKLVLDMQGRSTPANLSEGNSEILGNQECGSESH
jgi:hypothetical protein